MAGEHCGESDCENTELCNQSVQAIRPELLREKRQASAGERERVTGLPDSPRFRSTPFPFGGASQARLRSFPSLRFRPLRGTPFGLGIVDRRDKLFEPRDPPRKSGAGDETRTRDSLLGKQTLYH